MSLWDDKEPLIVAEYRKYPNDFLRQPEIKRCLAPNEPDIAKAYLTRLSHIPPAAFDPPLGNPHIMPGEYFSSQTIQHLYYLYLLGKTPYEHHDHVVEIGGGYGNLARIFRAIAYDGRYTIIDLPHMLDMQRDILSRQNITDVDFTCESIEPTGKSLLFATFSVNEMPMSERIRFENHYTKYDTLFFAHNRAIDGIDNVAYFNSLREALEPTHNIKYFKDELRKRDAWFMICRKK